MLVWGAGGTVAGAAGGAVLGGAGGTLVVPVLGTFIGVEGGMTVGGLLGGAIGATGGALRDGISFFAGRRRSKNDIPLVGGPPNGIATKPGTAVRYGPDGNAESRTCAGAGHGCEGAHTHIYTTGPNGKVNQKGQPRPATDDEIKETPPSGS